LPVLRPSCCPFFCSSNGLREGCTVSLHYKRPPQAIDSPTSSFLARFPQKRFRSIRFEKLFSLFPGVFVHCVFFGEECPQSAASTPPIPWPVCLSPFFPVSLRRRYFRRRTPLSSFCLVVWPLYGYSKRRSLHFQSPHLPFHFCHY